MKYEKMCEYIWNHNKYERNGIERLKRDGKKDIQGKHQAKKKLTCNYIKPLDETI